MFFPVIFQWGPILDFWCTQLNSRFKLEQFKIQADQFKFNSTQSTQFISECISNAACHFFLGASGDVKIVDWKEPAFRVAVQTGFQGEAVRRIDDKKRFFVIFLLGEKTVSFSTSMSSLLCGFYQALRRQRRHRKFIWPFHFSFLKK